MKQFYIGALVCIGAAILACSHDTTQACQQVIYDGFATYAPGIDLQVRDPFGQGQALGAAAVIRASDGSTEQGAAADTLNIVGEPNRTGTFSIVLTRPYYYDVTLSGVRVSSDGCGVRTTTIPVTMPLAPGAPPLRAMTILGPEFLYAPGVQVHLFVHFDANPSVTRAVTWSLSDTTLATVDSSGVVTAKCSKAGGVEKATATSVFDGKTNASAQFGVVAATSCP